MSIKSEGTYSTGFHDVQPERATQQEGYISIDDLHIHRTHSPNIDMSGS